MDRNVTIFDRRAVQRRRVLYAANARLLGSEEPMDCVVRSVSDIGAAVALPVSAPCTLNSPLNATGRDMSHILCGDEAMSRV